MTDQSSTVTLFDEDGLPWTSRLGWSWQAWLAMLFFNVLGLPIGIYLGLWIGSKNQSSFVLQLYVIGTLLFSINFLPDHLTAQWPSSSLMLVAAIDVAIWFGAPFILRRQVIRYYESREGFAFPISPIRTFFFATWYINGLLRADFPLNESGKAAPGILRLTT